MVVNENSEYIDYLLRIASTGLEKNLEIWSSNPRFMPYYSYSELKKFLGDPEAPLYEQISSRLKSNKIDIGADEERPSLRLT